MQSVGPAGQMQGRAGEPACSSWAGSALTLLGRSLCALQVPSGSLLSVLSES